MDYYHSKTPKENKKKHVKFATFFQLIFFVSDKPISPNRGVSTSPFTRRGVQNAVTYVLKYVEIYVNKRTNVYLLLVDKTNLKNSETTGRHMV